LSFTYTGVNSASNIVPNEGERHYWRIAGRRYVIKGINKRSFIE